MLIQRTISVAIKLNTQRVRVEISHDERVEVQRIDRIFAFRRFSAMVQEERERGAFYRQASEDENVGKFRNAAHEIEQTTRERVHRGAR